jgi:plasmid stabilization system protein ParE
MPRQVVLARRAQQWVNAELRYLSDRNRASARRLLDRLATARRLIEDFPRSGRRGSVPGTRRLVITPYVLTYREAEPDLLIIVDIRHGRQREALLPDDIDAY